jgi:pimeloyl-ACP methyl ester carboxylesterase
VIGGLERPPILIGHSAGGVFTQLMLDRGYGAVGVAINSAPTEGVPVVPLSQLKSTFPVLRTVGRKKAAGFTLEQWRYAFTNTFTEEDPLRRLGALPRGAPSHRGRVRGRTRRDPLDPALASPRSCCQPL